VSAETLTRPVFNGVLLFIFLFLVHFVVDGDYVTAVAAGFILISRAWITTKVETKKRNAIAEKRRK
jgi:hypothetical protein